MINTQAIPLGRLGLAKSLVAMFYIRVHIVIIAQLCCSIDTSTVHNSAAIIMIYK